MSDSKHRQDYHYKLFYTQIKTNPVVTATSIANQSEDLLQFTKALDPYRLDTESLYNQISLLINDNNQSILLSVRNPTLIEGIVLNLLHCSQLLPLDSALSIHKILLTLADKNEKLLAIINKQTQWQKLLHYWDKYKLLLALAIAITLCIIFFKLV